jgi:hypothetical protein
MTKLPVIATTALALFVSTPLLCTTATPASAHDWSDQDEGVSGDLRDRLMDRLEARRERRELIRDLLQERRDRRDAMEDLLGDRGDLRDRLRDRLRERLAGDDDNSRDQLRGRLRERIAERREGRGECYFVTRSIRDEDGDFLAVIRRRVCRD